MSKKCISARVGHLLLLAALSLPVSAQQPVPSEFQATFSELSTALARSALTQGWDQSKFPVFFGAEVTPASGYTWVQSGATAAAYYQRNVTPFLNALQTLGDVKMVKVLLHFPLLYRPFYERWPQSGGIAAYDTRLAFFQMLASDLRNRGISLMIQTMVQGFGASASIAEDPLNLEGYYRTLTFDDYVAARAEHTLSIVRLLRPDYVNFDSEPDQEAAKGLQPALDPNNETEFVRNNLRLVTTIRDAIVNANPPISGLHSAIRLVIGMGSFQRSLSTFVTNFTQMRDIDIIDIHVHPINFTPNIDYLVNITTIADAAIAQGKAVGMSETWLYHSTAADLARIGSPAMDARNFWSFWAPVDMSFLRLMMNYANFKRMDYVSFSAPNVFFSYLDYANTPGCPTPSNCTTAQWNQAGFQALFNAITSQPVPLTVTGQEFKNLLAAQASAPLRATSVSAASFRGPNMAADSIISVFGTNLATGQEAALALPLPTSLAGTTVTIRDSSGRDTLAGLLFVSSGQVNAYVPPGLTPGPGTITVRAADGRVSQGNIFIAGVAPGIFQVTSVTGASVVHGFVARRAADGTLTTSFTAQCTASGCSAVPVNLGSPSDTVVLVLFGTGIRGASAGAVTATVGGVDAPVLFAGSQAQFVGLDQVNIGLSNSLAGRGTVEVRLSAGGIPANVVTLAIQ